MEGTAAEIITAIKRRQLTCQLSMKALHNITVALNLMKKLRDLAGTEDNEVLGSLFLSSVVRYGRPFSTTETALGSMQVPTRRMKKHDGFDTVVHEHLMELRNRLLAHDDLKALHPNILFKCLTVRGSKISIPTDAHISNKALSHPATTDPVDKFITHMDAAAMAAATMLRDDVAAFREITMKHPDEAKETQEYLASLGSDVIPVGGKHISPDATLRDNPFLDIKEPHFSAVEGGYLFEGWKVWIQFWGPYEVQLEDGGKVVIQPPPEKGISKSDGNR